MIAHRCSLCPVERSGSPGLSRILPGLASDPVTRSERTFEVFRSTSPTCLHCCKPTVDPPFGSTSELPSAARTGSRRSPLLGLDEAGRVAPSASARPPLRRPSFRTPLSRSPRASTPGAGLSPCSFGLGMPLPKSRSVLVVSHHLDGFLRATARRLVASCCRPWGSSRFLPGRNRAFPATLPPLEERHSSAVGTPVTRRLGPLDVPPLARLSPSRLFPSNQLGTASPIAGRRCPGSPWASISSSRFP